MKLPTPSCLASKHLQLSGWNNRHTLNGYVLSGRYKAQLVEGSANGYLRTASDYVHLNPIRPQLLAGERRLLAFPWSSKKI